MNGLQIKLLLHFGKNPGRGAVVSRENPDFKAKKRKPCRMLKMPADEAKMTARGTTSQLVHIPLEEARC